MTPSPKSSKVKTINEWLERTAQGYDFPVAIDVEQSILGAGMIDRNALARYISILGKPSLNDDSAFYRASHRYVYQAHYDLFQNGTPVDLTTVIDRLRNRGELDKIDGAAYLVELTSSIVTTAHVEAHSRILLEKRAEREILRVCEETKLGLLSRGEDVFVLLDDAIQTFSELNDTRRLRSPRSLNEQAFDTIHLLEDAEGSVLGVSGIRSGFADIDRLTSGWQNGDLIILAARTSMGKTALSLDFVRGALGLTLQGPSEAAKHVYYVSKEMPATQIILRMLCSLADVEIQCARQGRMNDEQWKRVSQAAKAVSSSPLIIEDSRTITFNEIRSRARRLKQQGKLDLIVIDYLQKLATGEQDMFKEVTQLSGNLANLLLELEVPGIVLSQLNRGLENRQEKRPQLSDLRQSGAIEQDAALVGFIYRPEVYGIMTDEEGKSTGGKAEFILAKHRNGPTGKADLVFQKEYARFQELELQLDDNMGW